MTSVQTTISSGSTPQKESALPVLLLGCLLDLRNVQQADNIGWHENGCEDDLYRGFYMPQQ